MLDIRFVREHVETVRQKLQQRHSTPELLDRFSELDAKRRALVQKLDDQNATRNRESQEIGKLMKAGQKEEAETRRAAVRKLADWIEHTEAELDPVEFALNNLMIQLPNLPHDSVPIGADETANVELGKWGDRPIFDFEPLDHVALGTSLGILDLRRAAKITGARFSILTGLGARLERGLINFCLDLHTKRHGYQEVVPPFIVNGTSLLGTGQLPKFEKDLFKLEAFVEEVRIEGDDDGDEGYSIGEPRHYYLVPTAEVPLTNMYAGEILDGARLPIKMTAYTPCFRSEAGSYGKDTRGLIRQHQFDKVELVKITAPENSYDELESLTRDAETVLEELGLAYRRVALSTGDLGFSSAKTYDIEVWLPSQKTYREISSCSNCESFQARRASIRFRREQKSKPEFAHTLNGSGLAIGRLWVALLENYQQADGSVVIPEALRPDIDGLERIESKK